LLLDLFFLEAKTEAGLVFDLVGDFTATIATLPIDQPSFRILRLLREALRRDIQFIACHPAALFQSMWNFCWWYDCPATAGHYEPPDGGWPPEGPPWERPGRKLYRLLESWRTAKEERAPGSLWLRSLRPPPVPLGTGQQAAFRGHGKSVACVAWSPNGLRIAAGSLDGFIRVWDTASGKLLTCLNDAEGTAAAVAFSPDAGQLTSIESSRGWVKVWDITRGELLKNVPADSATTLRLDSGAAAKGPLFSPDGTCVAIIAPLWGITVWDALSGRRLACFYAHSKGAVSHLVWSPDGTQLLSAGTYDKTVMVWNVAQNRAQAGLEIQESRRADPPGRLQEHRMIVHCVAFSPDGARIASGSLDTTVRVWDAAAGRQTLYLCGHTAAVTRLAFSPDGTRLVSGSKDKTASIWDAADGRQLGRLCGHEGEVTAVAFSPDGKRIASGSESGTIRVWDTSTSELLVRLRGHKSWVSNVAFAPDGMRIYSNSRDKTARVWSLVNGQCLEVLSIGRPTGWPSDERNSGAWKAVVQESETVIESTTDGRCVAWFPDVLRCVTSYSSGRTWAGTCVNHLFLISLVALGGADAVYGARISGYRQ
jgi:WD40 repeat protein